MIDKKKIEVAANKICDYGSIYDSNYRIFGFKQGVKWATEELLKSLKHPTEEEPEHGKQITYIRENGLAKTISLNEEADKYNSTPSQIWHNICKNYKVVSWLYIDDLLPKRGGEQ
mgnify:CR=1 FL=1